MITNCGLRKWVCSSLMSVGDCIKLGTKQTEEKKALAYQLFSDSEGVFSQALGIAYKKEKAKNVAK